MHVSRFSSLYRPLESILFAYFSSLIPILLSTFGEFHRTCPVDQDLMSFLRVSFANSNRRLER